VLRPEWFEPELLRRECEPDDEAGRDKRPLHRHIFLDAAASASVVCGILGIKPLLFG
jgi:hypothetical protein